MKINLKQARQLVEAKATATAEENQFLRREVWRLGNQRDELLEACGQVIKDISICQSGLEEACLGLVVCKLEKITKRICK